MLVLPFLTPLSVVFSPERYRVGVGIQRRCLFGWGVIGYWYYAVRISVLVGLVVTLPFVAIVHATGALWVLVGAAERLR